MEIKPIANEDFMQLAELVVEMYSAIDKNINAFQAVNTLIEYVRTSDDFTAIGLYDDGVLLGFVTGQRSGLTTFLFTGIYLSVKNTDWTKQIIEFAFGYIKSKGYKAWEAETTNDNISSIIEKYGAKPKYTRYYKEFD